MRIEVVGAGPGGLYAALLLAKTGEHEVTVREQNAEGATYGWGVVFSDTTLTAFREADHPTFEAITDAFVSWDAIDIHYRGELVRAEGQPFAGIRRTALLGLLTGRCRDLGVDLRFEEQVEGVPGADLVVAADGVHSPIREAGDFGTSKATGAARYIWFGTPLPLDSFTFAFRETPHGLFQAHAYPFDGEMSTWIVECHEDVWREAGLDAASIDDSVAFCRDLFAEELRGRELLSNNSKWIAFETIRNRRWRQGNVVLLGDAAHTAHFSIGSGTKLAMEDAIALANAIETRDLDAALGDYEAERRPRVERFQEAAAASQGWFEHVARYTHMDPERFAFYLLTRSGRIGYSSLRVRDARLVERVDRTFGSGLAPPPLHQPIALRGLELANRAVAVKAAAGELAGLAPREVPGAGLVLSGIVAVSPEGRVTEEDLPMPSAAEVGRLRTAEGGPAIGLVIGHAGARGSMRPRSAGVDRPLREGGWELLSASPLPYGPGLPEPRALDRAEMDRVTGAFVEAAEGALASGAELLLVHMARGHLLASFISPLTNRREDRYGGGLEGRMRYPLEVFDAVRQAWPKDRPLGAVITADDWAPGGAGPDEAADVAGMLRDGGCDLVVPVAGQTVWRTLPRYGPAYLAGFADRIRNGKRVATLAFGAIETTDEANTLLAGGRADLVALG